MGSEILIGVLMAILGHAVHLLKKTVEARRAGSTQGLMAFIRGRPYRTALGVCASAAAMGWLFESGEVTAMSAFLIGYAADSAMALMDKRAEGLA